MAVMANGEATTELLRWNLTYQMTRILQKENKLQRASNLATSLVKEIKARTKQSQWKEDEQKKATDMINVLETLTSNVAKMEANAKKPKGKYFKEGSGFGKQGLFDNQTTAKTTPPASPTKVVGAKTTIPAKKKKKPTKKPPKITEEEDDGSWYVMAAGGVALVAATVAFFALRK